MKILIDISANSWCCIERKISQFQLLVGLTKGILLTSKIQLQNGSFPISMISLKEYFL